MPAPKRILFICPYPVGMAPSQRFRFEQYFPVLRQHALPFTVHSFLTTDNWKVFYYRGNFGRKALALALGYWRRWILLFTARRTDFVFIHREASPLGPPIFEWIMARMLGRRIIYDFDDAIWLTDQQAEGRILRFVKWRSKVARICQIAHRVSAGNAYLAAFARQFNNNVVINPTTIDTHGLHNPALHHKPIQNSNRLIIGWTGTHSTLKYLESIADVLQAVEQHHPNVTFLVIADRPPQLKLQRLEYVPWQESSEISDLRRIDIGIMPLPDDAWAEGKCGFKVLQYMALMIPSVSSPVGVNKTIVQHGVNGYLCQGSRQWIESLSSLIADPALRQRIGTAGRATVEAHYSVASNASAFLELFA